MALDERGRIELYERTFAAWNRGDIDAIVAECTPDLEWDMTRSHVPGQTDVYRGHDGYREFARSWRETLGPTQLELQEGKDLDDGRFYALIRQTATGPQSGVDVELMFVQIAEFEGSKVKWCAVFGDREEGAREAGLDG